MNLEKIVGRQMFELLPAGAMQGKKGVLIKKKRVLIGRSQACDIILLNRDVTSIHAVLEITENGAIVYDMNSTNGTYVNGESVVYKEVQVGDTLKFASQEYIFKKFQKEDILPPPLEMLAPISTGMPPAIGGVRVESSTPELPSAPSPRTGARLPRPSDSLPKDSPFREIPRVEYPLAKDPKAEFSEYIFEDADLLYPIFNYSVNYSAVEVIILFKDMVYSVDYVPTLDGKYKLVGKDASSKEIEYAYLGKDEKFEFVEVKNNDILVHPLPGYEVMRISGNKTEDGGVSSIPLYGDDILRFKNGDIQIFVRATEAPPRVKPAPILDRDTDLKKYLLLVFFFCIAFLSAVSMVTVDEEIEKEKVPERVATILYKRKLVVSKSPAIEKTKEAPKEKIQKSPVQKTVEKPKPTPIQRTAAKPEQTQAQKVGSKSATKVGEVKKATPNKGPTNNKTQVAPNKSTSTAKSSRARSAPSKQVNNVAAKGPVQTYKALEWKSTMSNILTKGGTTKGVQAADGNVSATGSTSSVVSGGESATLETAKVNTNVGSLVGAASGTLDSAKGVDGLVDKKSIFTAGLPYKTVVLGGMDPDLIRKILIDNIPRFRLCYQKELDRASQAIDGVVRLDFIIGASGRVTKAGVESASGSLTGDVKGCVITVLKDLRFPAPRGGSVVEVNQPFNFYPRRK